MAGFGDLLRRLRGTRTQKEVADALGMPVTTLSTLENQEPVPRGTVLKRFGDYYGVPISYFHSTPSGEMRSTDAAKAWLFQVKRTEARETGLATHASPDFPEDLKKRIVETIKRRKNG